MKIPNTIEGKPLFLSVAISERYAKSVKAVMKLMHAEMMSGLEDCFKSYAQDSDLPKNGNRLSQARILFNYLKNKYNPIFLSLAKRVTNSMIGGVM